HAGLERLAAALDARYRRLDILIGNAGVGGPSSPLGHVEPKAWDDVMAINVTANWQLIRHFEPLLRASDPGRAVVSTSGAPHNARAYRGPYGISKAALEALVRTFAAETASTSIRVNLFNPGPTRTRMRAAIMPGEDPMTLPSVEDVADKIVALTLPSVTDTGKLYDFRVGRLISYRLPAEG